MGLVDLTVGAALLAGILSFLSPCVLPLVPGYLSFISGVSMDELKTGKRYDFLLKVLVNILFFILGFSIVFTLIFVSAWGVSSWLVEYRDGLGKIFGIMVILFGLHFMGVIDFKALNYEKRMHLSGRKSGILSSMLVGITFSLGWSPCTGPYLATIAGLASAKDTVWQGFGFLIFYIIGLGIPFIISGLLFNGFVSFAGKVKKFLRVIEFGGGFMLAAVGVLLVFGYLQQAYNDFLSIFS
ncbi:MAG: cytochrome c biogenesis protein CcdA [candidate division Zixibacteria bacterium]